MEAYGYDHRPRDAAPVWLVPEQSSAAVAEPLSAASYCYLLDVDSDLAELFDLRMRLAVRQVATILAVDVPPGKFNIARWIGRDEEAPGLLVLGGVVAVDVEVCDRTTTELVGAGDLLQPWNAGAEFLIGRHAAWRALVPTRLGILDREFVERVRPWPQITHALIRRAGRRAQQMSVQRAIACQPRLEVRIALMLWYLAERWGRVGPVGVRLPLPLTHALLGRLVGAERPSVSHAVTRLTGAGLISGGAGDWHLHGSVEDLLVVLGDGPVDRPARPREPSAD
jgi:CRP/FNR family transcriptional regulator, cyclic AMP receptor protein